MVSWQKLPVLCSPNGVISSTRQDGLRTPQGGPRKGVSVFKNTLTKQPHSTVCPVTGLL